MKIGTKVRVKKVEPVFNCGIKAIDEEMKRIWRETPIYQRCRENIGKSGVITNMQDNYVFVEWTGEEGKGTWTPIECLEVEKLNCKVVCTINYIAGFTRGKIYEIKNSCLRDDDGDIRPFSCQVNKNKQLTIEDLYNCYGEDSFIEIVE